MQWVAVVQAVTMARFGPLKPNMMDKLPAIILIMVLGMKNGEILRGTAAVICVVSIFNHR